MLDNQTEAQIDITLRQQWDALWPQLLERFTTVSKADLDAALDVPDLVRRVSDRTHYSDRYVEQEIQELCATPRVQSRNAEGHRVPFGASSQRREFAGSISG